MRYKLAGGEALALWLALRDASAVCLAEVERAARDALAVRRLKAAGHTARRLKDGWHEWQLEQQPSKTNAAAVNAA